jgi:hypothetical protein
MAAEASALIAACSHIAGLRCPRVECGRRRRPWARCQIQSPGAGAGEPAPALVYLPVTC